MEAKDYLRKVYKLDELIRSNKEELEKLKELAKTILEMNEAKCFGMDYAEDEEIRLMIGRIEKAIRGDIARMLALKLEVREVINAVEDAEERLLLYERYMNFYTWDEICDKLNVSMRTVQRIHASALAKVKVPS